MNGQRGCLRWGSMPARLIGVCDDFSHGSQLIWRRLVSLTAWTAVCLWSQVKVGLRFCFSSPFPSLGKDHNVLFREWRANWLPFILLSTHEVIRSQVKKVGDPWIRRFSEWSCYRHTGVFSVLGSSFCLDSDKTVQYCKTLYFLTICVNMLQLKHHSKYKVQEYKGINWKSLFRGEWQ